jgi:hypothetical protein
MNISYDKSKLTNSLLGIDEEFRDKIIDTYIELKKRYVKSFFSDEYDSVGISSGKFCEIVFRLLEKEVLNKYTPFDKHISNFPAEINKITLAPSSQGSESLRVIIPRALVFIYTLRNKRGIGHVGGDIEANSIDISTIVKSIDWVICELIRLYHKLTLSEAQSVVDSLNIKTLPEIWNINGNRRVTKTNLTSGQKVLVLLYNELDNKAAFKDLFNWIEYSNISMFKSKIILPLHKERSIEFNPKTLEVVISPKGISDAEAILLNN